jgi:DNA processing protein
MDSVEQNSPGIEKWLRLIRAQHVGPTTFSKLLRHFSSIDEALSASATQLSTIEGISLKTAQQIAKSRDEINPASELELAEKLGVWVIHLEDKRYPAALKTIYDPPPVLYVKGTLSRRDNLAIAIVGSRRCSFYGQEQASRFAHLLASAGFTIVSGMARGIDSAAHQGALAAGGRTIAVQGAGLANPYPPENKKLFELISSSGACISELPLRYEPLAENFPPRNRIIAGLSLGVIVVEAALRSGALITARCAIENGREVMAVPGKIDSPISKGTHQLIKEGARLVESVDDVLETLGYIGQNLQEHVATSTQAADEKLSTPLFDIAKSSLSENERAVINCLADEPAHIEEIIARTGLPAGNINASLVSLRLKGLVKHLPGSTFLRK